MSYSYTIVANRLENIETLLAVALPVAEAAHGIAHDERLSPEIGAALSSLVMRLHEARSALDRARRALP